MRASITRRARYRRRRIRFMPAGERIITEHNAMSIKRTPIPRFILNISLRDDEKVKRAGNETRGGEGGEGGVTRGYRKGNKDGEARRK